MGNGRDCNCRRRYLEFYDVPCIFGFDFEKFTTFRFLGLKHGEGHGQRHDKMINYERMV